LVALAELDLRLVFIPLIAGVIGYVTNYVGVRMIFFPVRLHGITVPGLAALARLLPRRLQQIPGLLQGKAGWQGIVPSRAAKMGSIAVDKGIAKLGSPSEFYRQLNPEKIAEHILATAREDIRALDIDMEMPGADPEAKQHYELAVERYAQASQALGFSRGRPCCRCTTR
jgi:hypothetical protein